MRKLSFAVSVLLVFFIVTCSAALAAEKSHDRKSITLGFGATYERCMEMLKDGLERKGYSVDLKMFDSNELPARAMLAGEVDGLMQNHLPWIINFNKQNGSDFVMPEPYITYSLISLYSVRHDSLDDFPDGASIAIGSDNANMERGLRILDGLGFIKLGEKSGAYYTKVDIAENPKNIEIVEVETNAGVAALPDVDGAIVSAYRLWKAGYDPRKGLYNYPDGKKYPLSLVVNSWDAESDWVKEAQSIIAGEEFRSGFDEYYQGSYLLFNE